MLRGVGDGNYPRLRKLGIELVQDLLFHLPRRYEDTSNVLPLRKLVPGEVQTSQARVRSVTSYRSSRRKMLLVTATLEDDGDIAEAVWFNQPFIAKELAEGMEILVSGKVKLGGARLSFQNPKYEVVRATQRHVGRLAAVYPETEKLTSKFLRTLIEQVLPVARSVPDRLPLEIRERYGLLSIADALIQVHSPRDLEAAEAGRQRVAFEELFLLQVAAERARRRRLSSDGVVIPYDAEVARNFSQSLPFKLTDGQRIAAHEILTDMAATGPMNRLLQGDVGSGKTVVAAMAAVMTHHSGFQTAFMAPTEILARQHYATLEKFLGPHGLSPRLLVGSTSQKARKEILDGLISGNDGLIVGTHALIEDDVVLQNLGLVVVDEQHRFGVAQRQKLRLKAKAIPNFLGMTATPIPRSLALTLYGDVNLSELREMPPGRQPVKTEVVEPHRRTAAYEFIRTHIQQGRQAFVICPLIEESDKLGVKAATAEYERLRDEVFPDLRVELLHGRMPARDKEERMARFSNREADILVATSVVEVGVDIPNASIMVIEGAERFGIAQLHQFRGRVGRGADQSYCFLFEGSPDMEASKRLEAVASTQSGFELAELDLKLRGPGDVVGLRQHGLPEMMAADLLDVALAQRARQAAIEWLDQDPDLTKFSPLGDAMNGYRAVFDLD